jgi:hypothetical protein
MWNQGNWQVFSAGSPPPRSQLEANRRTKALFEHFEA